MIPTSTIAVRSPQRRHLIGVALVSAALLMTELALTRIFSVTMYYHFAFLVISIALFGLSASGVSAFLWRIRLARRSVDALLARHSLIYAAATVAALFALVRLRTGLTYSPHNLEMMLLIYAFAALPFFAGGLVLTIAISRFSACVNPVYAADLTGASAGCLMVIPLLDRLGAPGVVLCAAAMAAAAAPLFAPAASRLKAATAGGVVALVPFAVQLSALAPFDVRDTKGHKGDRVLFSKWNSFSRVAVYDRPHGDWSLSPAYRGERPETRFMDVDSAASTPILGVAPDLSNVQYLRYELTSIAYHLRDSGFGIRDSGFGSRDSGFGTRDAAHSEPAVPNRGPTVLVIGPGGGRDLVTALVFGAQRVDGVEINPIIANDVMRDRFLTFSGGVYTHPRVRIVVDDGRSFVRRSPNRYDVIQASLVDTWAATAAGAYTLTENTLYTVEAFNDYLDHLNDGGVVTITRWVFDGLRLVSLAQEACAARGWDPRQHIAIVRHDRVVTFLLKKDPFTREDVQRLKAAADALQFEVAYAPGLAALPDAESEPDSDWRQARQVDGVDVDDYARLVLAPDRHQFYATYARDIRPTTDNRPFFFHTTRLGDQLHVAFGRSMLFGNGLSALLTLMGISGALLAAFVGVPLAVAGRTAARGWLPWLTYFGALGAGFMLIEVALLQRLVLLLGHPLYSLTVTLFALLLGTGAGSALSRRVEEPALGRLLSRTLPVIAAVAIGAALALTPLIRWAIPFPRAVRMAAAAVTLLPLGMLLGIPMPAGIRVLSFRAPDMVSWAWGINGALSVIGATVAIFIAMNWGFGAVLVMAAAAYTVAWCLALMTI